MFGKVLLVFILSLVVLPLAYGEIEEVTLKVDGLACPFCVYGLEKKLKKVSGVSSYEVDRGGASASVVMEPDAVLDLAAVKNAVKEAGFTLSGITIKAKGNVADADTGLVFKVTNSHQIFLL